MTVEEIKKAIEEGKTVHWSSEAYTVIKDKINQYLIICTQNKYCIGLTHQDGTTMNGKEEDFYIAGEEQQQTIKESKAEINKLLSEGKEPYEIFCLDSSNGVYMSEKIQNFAIECGWTGYYKDEETIIKYNNLTFQQIEDGDYENAYDDAEEFLNDNIAPEGYYFGSNEDTGNYGFWKTEND